MAQQIEATLLYDKVWKRYHAIGNEMFITKYGKRIVPKLEYIVKGLASDKLYQFYIRFDPADNYRYEFRKRQWIGSEKWKKEGEPQMMCHPDGVQTGEEWMSTSVAFDRLRIVSDDQRTDSNKVFLHSSHKYIPVLIIFETQSRDPNSHSTSHPVAFIKIPHTEFICVSNYRSLAFQLLNDSTDRKSKYYSSGGKAQPKTGNRKRNRNATSTTSMVPQAPVAPLIAPMPPFPPLMPTFFPPPIPLMRAGFDPFLAQMVLGNMPLLPLLPFHVPRVPFPIFPTPPSTICESEHQEEKEEDKEEEDENVEIDVVN